MFPVIILAGGLATRLHPITEKFPKSMIEVAGKPFIDHQLNLLKTKGIKEVILCLGYLGEIIEEYVKDGSAYCINVSYSYDGDKLLGTGGAIKNIGDRLPDNFFVLYGDSYLDVDYLVIENSYCSSYKKALMTVYNNGGKWDSSNVVYNNNEIVYYSKKNKVDNMDYIDYGLGIFSKETFQTIKNEHVFDLADVYGKLIEERQLFGYEVYERFYEIGSIDGLNELEQKIIKTGSYE